MKILITGATGLIGRELGRALSLNQQYQIFTLSRSSNSQTLPFSAENIVADLNQGPADDPRLQQMEAVFHLAGEPVADGRWNEEKKKRIYDSRVRSTNHLIQSLSQKTKVLISASAVGYYGDRGDEVLSENSPAGKDFLAKVCVDWEKAAQTFKGRHVHLRTGFVLSRHGGAMEKMLPAFRWNLGGTLGKGSQWMSWIHLEDLVQMYIFALEKSQLQGPLNGVAPHPVTNRAFTEALAQTLGKRTGPAVPAFALKILFGEMAEMLLASQRVSAQKSADAGFKFHHTQLPEALQSLLLSQQ